MPLDATSLQQLLPSSYFVNGNLVVSQAQAEDVAAGIQAHLETLPEAQRSLFMALVKSSADLAPVGNSVPTNLEFTLEAMERTVTLIAALPGTSRSQLDFLTRAIVEQTAEQRKQALENRLMSRETARSELLNQAQQMKDAANQMMTGAIVALVVTVVVSAAALMAAGASTWQAGKGIEKMQGPIDSMKAMNATKKTDLNTFANNKFGNGDAANPSKSFKDLDPTEKALAMQQVGAGFNQSKYDMHQATMQQLNAKMQQSTNIGTIGQTLNQLGQGLANAASTMTQAQAKELEALGSIYAANAQYEEGQADNRKEIQQQLEEMVKQLIAFAKDLKETQANQMQALTKV